MTAKEKLFKRLPKKYHGMVLDIVPEGDLVDDCQYMLYFNYGVSFAGYENCGGFPVKSITEAIQTLKNDCEWSDFDEAFWSEFKGLKEDETCGKL